MRRSPRSISRIGSPSALSSDDRQAGTQYCRIRLPIGVPGPTCVNSSFSAAVVIALSPSILPPSEKLLWGRSRRLVHDAGAHPRANCARRERCFGRTRFALALVIRRCLRYAAVVSQEGGTAAMPVTVL